MSLKQAILSSFGRDDLKSLLDDLGIDGVDRRSVEAMRAKLGRSRSVSAETLLDGMRKDEIKQVCEDIGVPSAGTKQELIDRLMSNGSTSAKPAGNGKKTMSETSETKVTKEPKAARSNGTTLDLPALEQWLWDAACTIPSPSKKPIRLSCRRRTSANHLGIGRRNCSTIVAPSRQVQPRGEGSVMMRPSSCPTCEWRTFKAAISI